MATPEAREADVVSVGPFWVSLFEIGVVHLWVVSIAAAKDKPPKWVRQQAAQQWQGSEADMRKLFEVKKRELSELVALKAMGLE